MLSPPDNLFCLIENAIKRKPERLNMDNWHTLPNGEEALTENQILHPHCQHDLAGWIVVMTAGAVALELKYGKHCDDLANQILDANLMPKIPFGIAFGEREDAWKLIQGRAAEERSMN